MSYEGVAEHKERMMKMSSQEETIRELEKTIQALQSELASFELCEFCRENGKVHVGVPNNMMVDHDEVWALVNGADVYHKRIMREVDDE